MKLPRLGLPITLAVVMIVLVVLLTIGWVLLAVRGGMSDAGWAPLYWTLLSVGTTFLVVLVLGVIWYLVLSIKTISLSRRQSNFIDSVTHELKSPIASLKLYVQTLRRREMSPQQQANFFQSMLEDLDRLDRLVNQVLSAGQLERRPEEDEAEDVDVTALLAECVSTACLRYRVPPENVQLQAQPCTMRARRVDLAMIFGNLIDNAVKYAGNEPKVEVSLVHSNGAVVAQVGDNGRGIPPKMRRRIFGRFERLGMELTRKKPGTGLGLYIVRTLVKRMKGRIRVHDRPEGPGTVFEVQLPC